MPEITLLPLEKLTAIVLAAGGISWILTGSSIGFWARFLWCFALRWSAATRYFWPIMRCPPCNAFWTGAALGFLVTHDPIQAAQIAVTASGFLGILQGITGRSLAADEDMERLLGVAEDQNHGERTDSTNGS